ncbi:hypothetical protein V8B97DRAFT_62498 [Scleroderma yunnanense]
MTPKPPERSSRPSPPPIATIEYLYCADDTNEEDQLSLMRLSRFACQSSSSQPNSLHRRTSIPSSLFSRSNARVEPTQISKPVSRGPSDAQLSKIIKCVCCDLQWTTKKTVRQKRVHIEQCTKKQGITHDTLLILINKETSTPSIETALPKENDVSTGVPGENATLMDAIIAAEGGKGSRRKQVIGTVKSLPETRMSIIRRAKDVLGDVGQSDVYGDHLGMNPTQQFGKSILAHRNTAFLSYTKETPPMSTQAFGESALCAKRTTSRMFDAYLAASSGSLQSQHTTMGKRPPSPSSEDTRNVKARLAQET